MLCQSGGSITCKTLDIQVSSLIEAIELGPRWLEEVLAIISLKDEVDQIKKKKQAIQEKLRRMGKVYVDGVFPDEEYHRQKKLLEMELESLVVPAANAAVKNPDVRSATIYGPMGYDSIARWISIQCRKNRHYVRRVCSVLIHGRYPA